VKTTLLYPMRLPFGPLHPPDIQHAGAADGVAEGTPLRRRRGVPVVAARELLPPRRRLAGVCSSPILAFAIAIASLHRRQQQQQQQQQHEN